MNARTFGEVIGFIVWILGSWLILGHPVDNVRFRPNRWQVIALIALAVAVLMGVLVSNHYIPY
jgi:hypothetical protein